MRKLLSVLSSTLQGGVRGRLLLLLLVASAINIYASDIKVGGIWYDFDSSTKTASVTYRGSEYNSYSNEYSGSVIIPETITYNGTTYSVTSIGEEAFMYCSSLTSVTIGESVTSIGDFAFFHCSSLTSVTIPNSVTSIGEEAFYGCSSLTKTNYIGDIAGWCNIKFGEETSNPMCYSHNFYINDQEIKNLVIPNSVTSIGNYAFNGCSSLTSVTIGESVTSIGSYAFYNCSSLTKTNYTGDIAGWCNIIFGDNYANPMYYSHNFYINDQEIKKLVIPNSVTSIDSYAFSYCYSLTSVTIGESVTSIGSYAFSYCYSLTSVTIPNSVTSIGNYAFYGCSSLPVENNLRYADTYLVEAVNKTLSTYSIKEGTKWVGSSAFYNCQPLTSIKLPNSVTSIGDDAFSYCSSLTSVTIPESVTSIGFAAFYYCSSLTSVTIPNSVTNIGGSAFNYCSSLTSVTIGESVTSIGGAAFYGCSSLTSVTIGESVTSIGDYAFNGCSSLTSVTIGESVTSIGYDAFYGCSSLTKTNYTGDIAGWCNIKFEDYDANPMYYSHNFYINDQEIKNLVIPESVTSIGNYAFYSCSKLTSVTIGESVTSIGDYAFRNCSSLTSVTIPNSVTSIGNYAFSGCSSLPVENNLRYADTYLVEAVNKTLSTYSIKEGTKWVGYAAFADCSSLTSVTIPNSVTSIGYAAFADCESLTSVTIPNSVTSIGDYAFQSCDALSSVTIGNSVTSIGDEAFYGCSQLENLTLGTAMENIGSYAFAGCDRMYHIYSYSTNPPVAYQSSFANYNVYLHVPCDYKEGYDLDIVWGNFKYIQCIESEDVTTDGVLITPSTNNVTITWPTEGNADTYTIVIKKGDTVFCTLTFNADGQLLNIAFAPGRDGNHPAQYAEQAGNGYRFTVTGLEEATHYTYNIDVRDAANQTINSYSGEFTTLSNVPSSVDNTPAPMINCTKTIHDGQLLILRDGRTYTIMGAEIQ